MAKTTTPYEPQINDIAAYRGSTGLVLSLGGVGSMQDVPLGSMQDVPLGSTEYLSHEPTVLMVDLSIISSGMDRQLHSFRVPTRLVTYVGKYNPELDAVAAAPVAVPIKELIVADLLGAPDVGMTISQLAASLQRPSAAIHSSLQSLKTAGRVAQRETLEWHLLPQAA